MKIRFIKKPEYRFFYFESPLPEFTHYGYNIPSITFVLIDTISNYGSWSKQERLHITSILKEIDAKR